MIFLWKALGHGLVQGQLPTSEPLIPLHNAVVLQLFNFSLIYHALLGYFEVSNSTRSQMSTFCQQTKLAAMTNSLSPRWTNIGLRLNFRGSCRHLPRKSNVNAPHCTTSATGYSSVPSRQFFGTVYTKDWRKSCTLMATNHPGMFEVEDVSPPPQSLGLHNLPPVSYKTVLDYFYSLKYIEVF